MSGIFFVSGAPKSGTTWLQMLLDAHPELVCSGEGHFIERLYAPLKRMQADYDGHMKLVAERVYQGRPYYAGLPDTQLDAAARRIMLDMIRQRATPQTKALGDKTPRYHEFLRQLLLLFPEARFIDIVRDPRDVTVSRLHHAVRAGHADALEAGSEQYLTLVRNSAMAWRAARSNVAAFAQAHPGRLLQLRYEDLLLQPEEGASGAFRFLEVRNTRGVVQKAVEASSFEALSGRKRGQEDPTSFFRKGVAGDWEGVLDDWALAAITAACGDGMERHGYAKGAVRNGGVASSARHPLAG